MDETQKIVEFGTRRPTGSPSPRKNLELLRHIQMLAQRRLSAVATAVFEQVDDALFDLADRSGSSGAQQQFFDGMREIRRRRQEVEDRFLAHVEHSFADYVANRALAAADTPAAPPQNEGELTLSLVEDAELEAAIALTSMAARAESHLSQTLLQLNRRFAALMNRESSEELTPMSPRVICQSFVVAVRELDVTLQVRLILLKLFERHFVPAHQATCEEANRTLVDSGVMPQLRFKAPPRKPGEPVHAPMVGTHAGAPDAPGVPTPPGTLQADADGNLTFELPQELYAQLQSLLAARRQTEQAEPGFGGVSYGLAPLTAHEILSALSMLQAETSNVGAAPPAMAHEFKQALVAQAGRLAGASRANRMHVQDEDAIDLVGMLFEFMIEDRQLPSPIQSMLARLQIPFLRAALIDRQLFTQKAHPARRLLDSLAEAGVGWSEQVDKDGRVIAKIREVVETLTTDFNEDVQVFDRLAEDFTGFISQQRRRAELAEQRAAEAARGREKLEAARTSSQAVVSKALRHKGLPEVVREVLVGPWTKYLEIVHARRGGESPEWRAATKLVDDLVWSVDPETVSTESKHWGAMLPSIDATLKQGLAAVGFHEADSHRVLAKLRQTYAGVLEAAKMGGVASVGGIVPSVEGAANEDPAFDSAEAEAPAFETTGSAAPAGEQSTMAEQLATARGLKIGQWVEFDDEQTGIVRAKLSWVSAITQRYLFVNQNGLKVAEKTLYEVAADLKLGHLRILEDNPLFDRALSAIVKRLRSA